MKKEKRKRKMGYMIIFIVLAIAFTLFVQVGPKLPNMNEGEWEITVEAQLPDAKTGASEKTAQMLTKKIPVPAISIPGYECRIFNKRQPFHVVWNFVLWKVHCESADRVIIGSGYIRYSGDTLKGKMQMHTQEDNQKRFNAYITGFRTGEAKKK